MPEQTTRERLQPSLLDRLTDDEPHKKRESRDSRVISFRKLREGVMRDLAWLLNTTNLATTEALDDYPLAARSVINYGLPGMAGIVSSNVDVDELEASLRQAVQDFEPRILKNTVKVRVRVADEAMNHNALTFEIEGELWAQPVPERLFLKTDVDLETGNVEIEEHIGPGSS